MWRPTICLDCAPGNILGVTNVTMGGFVFPSIAELSKYKVLVTTLATAGKLYSASLMVKLETITIAWNLNILGRIMNEENGENIDKNMFKMRSLLTISRTAHPYYVWRLYWVPLYPALLSHQGLGGASGRNMRLKEELNCEARVDYRR